MVLLDEILDDLLLLVFENLSEPGPMEDTAVAIRPILTVCKRWHSLANPIFWKALTFRSVEKLVEGMLAIREAETSHKNIRHWVRKLVVYIPALEYSKMIAWHASLTAILNITTELEDVLLLPCMFDIAILIARVTSNWLKTLDLHFSSVTPVFREINLTSFTSLTSLTLGMLDIRIDGEDHDIFTPCTMPHLHTLHWQGYSTSGFFRFLTASTFGALSDVEVFTLSPLSDVTMPQLKSFFQRNAMDKLSLTLGRQEEFADLLPSLHTASLMPMCGDDSTLPPPSIIAQLPSSVKTLELHGVEHHEGIWPILEAIKASDTCKLETVAILTSSPGNIFTWIRQRQGPPVEAHLHESAFMGNLLLYAIVLARRGIEMIDRRGFAVYDYFPYS